MKKKTLLLISCALASTQLHAAPGCTQANLNGNYVMYQAAVNNPNLNHTGKCTITIISGVVSGSCAFGPNVSGNPNFSGPVYSPVTANAVMNSNCSATIPISFDPVPGSVHIDSVFDVQFTADKQSFIGRFGNNFGLQGTSNGTRYSPALPSTPAP
jgi:hypothetical protein